MGFKEKFGYELCLEGASYGGNGDVNEYKYRCDHELLKEFRNEIHALIRGSDCPASFAIVTDSVSLYVDGELSESQIRAFERNLDVRCRGFERSCSSDQIQYKFA